MAVVAQTSSVTVPGEIVVSKFFRAKIALYRTKRRRMKKENIILALLRREQNDVARIQPKFHVDSIGHAKNLSSDTA